MIPLFIGLTLVNLLMLGLTTALGYVVHRDPLRFSPYHQLAGVLATGRIDPEGVPALLVLPLFAVPVAAGVCDGMREAIQRHRVQHGLCPGCGYNLRASPGRCPECGEQPATALGAPTSQKSG